MTDTRPRDVYRVWHRFEGSDTEYASFHYAIDAEQAREIAQRRIAKSTDKEFEITGAEKR